MKKCTNAGCNEEYNEESNNENSCAFHDGKPLFHEGLKGWSCCSKRVTDFDELFKITGCKTGKHKTEDKKSTLPDFLVKSNNKSVSSSTEEEGGVSGGGVEVYKTKGGESLFSKASTSLSNSPLSTPYKSKTKPLSPPPPPLPLSSLLPLSPLSIPSPFPSSFQSSPVPTRKTKN